MQLPIVTLLLARLRGAVRGVQLAVHFSLMDSANYCHGMASSHCFETASLTAISSPSHLTSKTDLLTSSKALRKLLTSKANLTLSSHSSLTSSLNLLIDRKAYMLVVFGFFFGGGTVNQLHASWVWRHGNHGIQEAAIRQPSSNLFYKEVADSIWNVDGLKKKNKTPPKTPKTQRQMEGWSEGGSR